MSVCMIVHVDYVEYLCVRMTAHVCSVEHMWMCSWLHMHILWSIHEYVYDCPCKFCEACVSVLLVAHVHSVEHMWVCTWLHMYALWKICVAQRTLSRLGYFLPSFCEFQRLNLGRQTWERKSPYLIGYLSSPKYDFSKHYLKQKTVLQLQKIKQSLIIQSIL